MAKCFTMWQKCLKLQLFLALKTCGKKPYHVFLTWSENDLAALGAWKKTTSSFPSTCTGNFITHFGETLFGNLALFGAIDSLIILHGEEERTPCLLMPAGTYLCPCSFIKKRSCNNDIQAKSVAHMLWIEYWNNNVLNSAPCTLNTVQMNVIRW